MTDLLFQSQGLVDLDAEIAKSQKKLGLAQLNVDKMKKLMAQPGYEQNLPEDVRAQNRDTVRFAFPIIHSIPLTLVCHLQQLMTSEAQVTTLEQTIASFEKLR